MVSCERIIKDINHCIYILSFNKINLLNTFYAKQIYWNSSDVFITLSNIWISNKICFSISPYKSIRYLQILISKNSIKKMSKSIAVYINDKTTFQNSITSFSKIIKRWNVYKLVNIWYKLLITHLTPLNFVFIMSFSTVSHIVWINMS